MPNLINDNGYNGLGGLAQNYRRVATGGSNLGTRRIQFYQVVVYGISDAEVAKLDNYRLVNNTEVDIDQEPEREFKTATVAEAVVRSIQSNGELYVVGAHDTDYQNPDYNNFYIVIGIAGDTYSSGYEMNTRDDPATRANNNPYLNEALRDALDGYLGNNYDDFDVYPTFIYGDHFSTITYPNTLVSAERKAIRQAEKAARIAGGAQLKRNPG
jgi:hypothetical protein